MDFINSSYFDIMRKDIMNQYRKIGHALDNYGINMSRELKMSLEELYKAIEKVEREMDEEYVKNKRTTK